MNYVRNFGSTISDAWNSINPATLSGAIDVIVVEQEDGKNALTCTRNVGVLTISRPLWQVPITSAVPEEGERTTLRLLWPC
jgi:hypothetical protein